MSLSEFLWGTEKKKKKRKKKKEQTVTIESIQYPKKQIDEIMDEWQREGIIR